MANVMAMQNTSGALNPNCLAARSADKAWECMFAQNSYAVTEVPTFVENSALDAWQMWCIYVSICNLSLLVFRGSILTECCLWLQGAAPLVGFPNATSSLNGNCSAAPGWRACVSNPENCTSTEMVAMNDWMDDYVGTLNATKTFHAPGNGAFIHSCHVNPQSALHQ